MCIHTTTLIVRVAILWEKSHEERLSAALHWTCRWAHAKGGIEDLSVFWTVDHRKKAEHLEDLLKNDNVKYYGIESDIDA